LLNNNVSIIGFSLYIDCFATSPLLLPYLQNAFHILPF
jgi:hypothetical protein